MGRNKKNILRSSTENGDHKETSKKGVDFHLASVLKVVYTIFTGFIQITKVAKGMDMVKNKRSFYCSSDHFNADNGGMDLKIGKAKELYKDFGAFFYADEAGRVVEYRKNEWTHCIDNDTYIHALFLTDLMFQNTHTSLKMVAGSGVDGFLSVLKDSFVAALRRLKAKGRRAELILASAEEPQLIREIKQEVPDSLDVIISNPSKPDAIEHLIICDSTMVREEEPHLELTDDMDIDVIKADVYLNNRARARIVLAKFEAIKKVIINRR